jgi:hypothetical protein
LRDFSACESFCSEVLRIASTTAHGLLGAAITDGLKLALMYFRPPIEIKGTSAFIIPSTTLQWEEEIKFNGSAEYNKICAMFR